MIKKINIFVFILVSIYLTAVLIPEFDKVQAETVEIQPIETIDVQKAKIDTMSVVEIIDYVAPQFNQDPKLISKISYCESGHTKKNHDNNRGYNVTGIHDKTWYGWLPLYEKERGETLDIDSTFDQLKMMSWAFSKGSSYRNQWTTYVAYTNGGIYTFYSKLLKAWFTVKCS